MPKAERNKRYHIFLLLSLIPIFLWSLIKCFDLYTWVLESAPVIIGGVILISVYRKFRLTNLAYILIWLHAVILLIGAHYTYAKMPFFNWIADVFDLSRNHYDRLGHFVQGFTPAILAREILLRTSPLKQGKWLFVIVISICLAISAAYELLEWMVAVIAKTAAEAFLGTQGDNWDTQKDMAFCLLGAVVSLITLSKFHNKDLKNIKIKTTFCRENNI